MNQEPASDSQRTLFISAVVGIHIAMFFLSCFAAIVAIFNEREDGIPVAMIMVPMAQMILALYLAPAYFAWWMKHPRLIIILLVNALLGWTCLGWLAAGMMSFNLLDGFFAALPINVCPACKQNWAAVEQSRRPLRSWQEYETVQRKDEHRAGGFRGMRDHVGTTLRYEQIVVQVTLYQVHWQCKHCHHEWITEQRIRKR